MRPKIYMKHNKLKTKHPINNHPQAQRYAMASKIDSLLFCASVCVVLCLTASAFAKIEDHIVKTESGFYYTVQKGDTLWDLSRQFKDSPWEWPELWSNNPQIANPHLIYPGQKILIFKKDWEGKEKIPQEEIPPLILPVIEPAPAALPESAPGTYSCSEIDGVGFIRKTAVEPMGFIFKTGNEHILTSDTEDIYIRPESNAVSMAVGDPFVLFRTFGPIYDNTIMIGYQHYLTGIARITRIEPGYAVARVEKAFHEIELQDAVMPYHPRPAELALKEGLPGIVGKVIGPEESHLMLVGENHLIFIDKGKENGVEPGQQYSIYKQDTAVMDPKTITSQTLSPELVGKLIVLHAEDTTSTARIINSMKNIEIGYLIGNL